MSQRPPPSGGDAGAAGGAHAVDEVLDEAADLLERTPSLGHVVLDEAQDLSPMQWRMVGRRGRSATWTVVGDPAQSSWPVPAEADAAREEARRGLLNNHPSCLKIV